MARHQMRSKFSCRLQPRNRLAFSCDGLSSSYPLLLVLAVANPWLPIWRFQRASSEGLAISRSLFDKSHRLGAIWVVVRGAALHRAFLAFYPDYVMSELQEKRVSVYTCVMAQNSNSKTVPAAHILS